MRPLPTLVRSTALVLRFQAKPTEPQFPNNRDEARRWFRGLLWDAFPDARTDHELACLAAARLGVSEGRVRGWLRCDHEAKLFEVLKVLWLARREILLLHDSRR